MNKIRLILLLVLVIGCGLIYQLTLGGHERRYPIISKTLETSTMRLIYEKSLDFLTLSRDLRQYSSTHNRTLQEKLFPWWFHRRETNNSKQYQDGMNTSTGIIICTGNRHFRLALVALKALELIGNELPIEII